MAICTPCQVAGDTNRELFNKGEAPNVAHPDNCECMCQHMPTIEWEGRYLVPNLHDSDN